MAIKVAPALLVSFAVCACAHGAIVSLTQTSPDPYNDPSLGPTTATFDVVIEATSFPEGIVWRVDMEIAASSGPPLSLEPSPEWEVPYPPCDPLCVFEAYHLLGGTPTPSGPVGCRREGDRSRG